MLTWTAKDPTEVLDYQWVPALDAGDTIASYTVAVSSGTVAIDDDSNTTTAVTVWTSGGTTGEIAYFTFTATTAGGRTFRESVVLPVFDRATETLATFRLRYPAFASIDDGVISYRLAESLGVVGTEWPEDARIIARTAYAAHKMAEAGTLASAIPQGVTSFKSGTFSASISDATANLTGLNATIYGREFVAMRRSAFAGPRLSWTPPVAD